MKDLITRVTPSVAEVLIPSEGTWKRNGTGFAIDTRGLIATCHHVIANSIEYKVQINGKHLEAKRLSIDPAIDLAILGVEAYVQPLPLSSLALLDVGKEVAWCGYPNYTWLLNWHKGIVSYIGDVPGPGGSRIQGIQLDGTVNRGNSGGPILAMDDGAVVGIVSASLGGLNEKMEQMMAPLIAGSGGAFIGGIDPNRTFYEVLEQIRDVIQLGVGYGISVDYLSKMKAAMP